MSDSEQAAVEPDQPGWNPDGVDLAKTLVARAKAANQRGSSGRSSSSSRRSRRSAPGSGWSGPAGDERDPKPLEAAVDRLVDEHGWSEEIAVHGVVARWDQIVGPEVASHVAPERYADGVLTVRADSTAWATQVRMLAPTLVRRLNEEIGDGVVIRVTVLGPHAPSWRKGPRSVPGRGPRDTYG
jgi:predicted nucleic acid-binding Zn ribbon protein